MQTNNYNYGFISFWQHTALILLILLLTACDPPATRALEQSAGIGITTEKLKEDDIHSLLYGKDIKQAISAGGFLVAMDSDNKVFQKRIDGREWVQISTPANSTPIQLLSMGRSPYLVFEQLDENNKKYFSFGKLQTEKAMFELVNNPTGLEKPDDYAFHVHFSQEDRLAFWSPSISNSGFSVFFALNVSDYSWTKTNRTGFESMNTNELIATQNSSGKTSVSRRSQQGHPLHTVASGQLDTDPVGNHKISLGKIGHKYILTTHKGYREVNWVQGEFSDPENKAWRAGVLEDAKIYRAFTDTANEKAYLATDKGLFELSLTGSVKENKWISI